MEIYKKQSLSEAFKVYFDQRMIKILLLGAISGFPWVIICLLYTSPSPRDGDESRMPSSA